MPKRVASFLALPAAERLVLLRAAFWLPVTVLALKLRGMGREVLAAPPAVRPPSGAVAPARIAHLVAIAARHGLARGNCLSQSLTLSRLLRAHGHGGQLRIGARRGATGLEAHAWVEHDGRPLNDAADVAQRYVPFPTLPALLPRLV